MKLKLHYLLVSLQFSIALKLDESIWLGQITVKANFIWRIKHFLIKKKQKHNIQSENKQSDRQDTFKKFQAKYKSD